MSITVTVDEQPTITVSVGENVVDVSLEAPALSVSVSTDLSDAPSDGSQYARQDGSWSVISLAGYLLASNNLSDLASASTARTNLGLVIGTNVQAWDAQLDDISGLAVTDSNFMVGDGANWVAESGATVRTSLGLGSGDSPTFAGLTTTGAINIGGGTFTGEIINVYGSGTLSRLNFQHSGTGQTGNDGALFGLNNANFYFWNREAGVTYFGTSGENRMSIGAGGGVTITGGTDTQQLIVKAHSSQTANILEIQDSGGSVLASIDGSGDATFPNLVVTNRINGGLYVINDEVAWAMTIDQDHASGYGLNIVGASGSTQPLLRVDGGAGTSLLRVQGDGKVGLGKTPLSALDINLATEDLEVVDAGSASASEQDWVEVEVGGNQGYIRVYATK